MQVFENYPIAVYPPGMKKKKKKTQYKDQLVYSKFDTRSIKRLC